MALGVHSPRRSMVSLILLAAFSLSNPGWLLLMENRVMTPERKRDPRHEWGQGHSLLGGLGTAGSPQSDDCYDLKLGELETPEKRSTVGGRCAVYWKDQGRVQDRQTARERKGLGPALAIPKQGSQVKAVLMEKAEKET